jgi:hypothetical protein
VLEWNKVALLIGGRVLEWNTVARLDGRESAGVEHGGVADWRWLCVCVYMGVV